MGERLLRGWWIAAGLLVAWLVARAIGSPWAWVFAVYVLFNLVGTVLLRRELQDHEDWSSRTAERWESVVEVAFVLQLPVGAIVLALELV